MSAPPISWLWTLIIIIIVIVVIVVLLKVLFAVIAIGPIAVGSDVHDFVYTQSLWLAE